MEYKIIEEGDHETVIGHLRRTFFIDEPLNKAVQLCPNGEGHAELERSCVATMRDGYSILATENGVLMGVALNGVSRPGDAGKSLNKLMKSDDEKFRKIFTLLFNLTEHLDLFNKFGVDSIFEIKILSVDPAGRGKGLAGELASRSVELAKQRGFRLVKSDATGLYSQKIYEGQEMETLIELHYKDYLDPETGLPVFEVDPPHNTLKVVVKQL